MANPNQFFIFKIFGESFNKTLHFNYERSKFCSQINLKSLKNWALIQIFESRIRFGLNTTSKPKLEIRKYRLCYRKEIEIEN